MKAKGKQTGHPGACALRGTWQIVPLILSAVVMCLTRTDAAFAQTADFQIVWVVVGEAEANANGPPVRAGRHVFMASDLMSLSMKNVKVARVDVAPAVSQIATGQRLCISSLKITAYAPGAEVLKSAPLSVSVRQDQKQKLALMRDKNDICVTPNAAGEYPIRFASLLPAADGTTRGSQIFLRVSAAGAHAAASKQ